MIVRRQINQIKKAPGDRRILSHGASDKHHFPTERPPKQQKQVSKTIGARGTKKSKEIRKSEH